MAKKNYVNNKEFYKAMCEYIPRCRKAAEEGKPRPPIPNFIGECLLLIANNLSKAPNFASYSYKDEMISDAIENCCRYIHNFNPDKNNNPFAYFTQTIKFAFIRRIQREQKEMYTKYKNYDRMNLADSVAGFDIKTTELNEQTQQFIKSYEDRLAKKKLKKAVDK